MLATVAMTNHKVHTIAAAAALLLMLTPISRAAQPKSTDEIAAARLQLDIEQSAFNRKLEIEKLEVQKLAAWTSALALMIPLLVASLSLGVAVWSQRQNARLQREFQERTEKNQFELKAAELAFAEKGPHGTHSRARALRALFPERLPIDFSDRFDPKAFLTSPGESSDAKFRYFEAVAPHVKDPDALLEVWKALFPADTWPSRVASTTTKGQNAA